MFFIPPDIRFAIDRLNSRGHECFLVGGSVRDFLLNLSVKDYDLTTSASPEEVIDAFSGCKVFPTGLKHGTVTLLRGDFSIEITTYRIDSNYSDNRAPDSVSFTKNLTDDLARRDFTMNAVCYHPKTGFVDPYGGMADIRDGIIRTVGNPAARFGEDALRILRAVRFASVLGFAVENDTSSALFSEKGRLKNISSERIFTELKKLLCGINVKNTIERYCGILGVFMPELLPLKGFEQNSVYHIHDVLTHTLIVVENVPAVPFLRLAALMHDIGKPECYSVGEDGHGHFYGHPAAGVEIAGEILSRLKCDNKTQEKILFLIKHHDDKIIPEEKYVKRFLNKTTPEGFAALLALKRADILAQSPDYRKNLAYVDSLEEIANKIIAEEQCFSLRSLAVNGDDLIKNGFAPGREIGKALDLLLEKVISGELENEYNVLIKAAEQFKR